jgi:integrase
VPRAPRGKRVIDSSTGSFVVVNRAQRGQPDPFFDRSRNVWVAPWRKADGRTGRPTGRTRAAAEASRDRHVAAELEAGKFAPLSGGFHADTSLTELSRWWLDHVARHRVRVTTWSTYEKQLHVVNERLGEVPVRRLRPEQVAGVIADIANAGSASRARNIRMLLVQLLDEAVNLGLAEDNVARKVRSPRVPKVQRRTLSPAEVARLVSVCDERYVAAVALCFVQGWRVSEALGLAWQDLDLDAGTVRLRRGATYADGIGMVLGAPKTSRTAGRQLLAPTTLTLLAAHHDRWQRLRGERVVPFPEVSYQGEVLDLVFVNPAGSLMLRQHVDKAIRKAAEAVGLDPSEIGTHTGRRSVVTNLYASGDLDLEDVARFVGHSDVSTTRGYVQSEGERPQMVSRKAFGILDPGVDASGR